MIGFLLRWYYIDIAVEGTLSLEGRSSRYRVNTTYRRIQHESSLCSPVTMLKVCVCVCACVCVRVRVCVFVCESMSVCPCLCQCMYLCLFVHNNTYKCVYADRSPFHRSYTYVYQCMCVRLCKNIEVFFTAPTPTTGEPKCWNSAESEKARHKRSAIPSFHPDSLDQDM